jgi:hypothetical protein
MVDTNGVLSLLPLKVDLLCFEEIHGDEVSFVIHKDRSRILQ